MKRRNTKKKDHTALFDGFLKDAAQVNAVCSHYGECGGCNLQQYSYKDQLSAKLNVFKQMVDQKRLSRQFSDIEITAFASPRQTSYRQKMDFVCSFQSSGQRGSSFSHVVNLNECHLIDQVSFDFYQRALNLSREYNIPDYNLVDHRGFLRYITVRRTRLGKQLVSFLTSNIDYDEEMSKIAETLLKEGVDSVVWQLSEGQGDSSFGAPHKIWGLPHIEEAILGNRFLLSTNTFFQANQEVAEKAYSMIKEHAATFTPKTVLDLYSGTCTIGITLSDCAEKVVAVENFLPNRDMAFKNFEINNVNNIEYINEDVGEYLKTTELQADFAVCNPPRVGVDERPLRQLMKLKPQGISYLSCNPKTLLEDLAIMTLHYNIESATVLDMFPQTKHFETLIQLRLKS